MALTKNYPIPDPAAAPRLLKAELSIIPSGSLTPPAWRVLDGIEQKSEQAERVNEGSISDVENAEEAPTE